ncbi:MAG: hypothetical protein Q9166_003041 [cf. Caloplaca sp. 2 TL-2023]
MESSGLERHLSNAEEAQLAEALNLRRRQIDREIEEFKADKEKEFRKFEKRLRSEKRDSERQKILQCEREVEKANQKRRGSRDPLALLPANSLNGTRDGDVGQEGTRSNGVRFANALEIPLDDDTGQPEKEGDQSTKVGTSQDQQPSHERELEFQGLFTPTYLPLLGGYHQDQEAHILHTISSRSGDLSPSDKPALSSAPAGSHLHAPISGSAPSTPALLCDLSSSDPRKISMSERRSSSRSDTSVSSRRSSIRDRKQPRSPKRVLFSIDNVVVSPSTSPTLQRKANASRKNGNSDRSVVVPSDPITPKDEVIEGYKSPVHRRDYPSLQRQPGKPSLTNVPTTNGLVNGGSRPLHPAAQIASLSPSMGGDGFEHIRGDDDDDLFAFDEDVTYRKKHEDHDDIGDDTREDDLGSGPEELPTSSPHAGSLPIEIRWPGRKNPRG